MTTSFNHAYPWIFVGPFLMALAACPSKNEPGTTDDPENEDTTSDPSTSSTTAAPTSSGPSSTPTGETTAPSEPDTSSTSSSSTSSSATSSTSSTSSSSTSSGSTDTLDPDTTGGDACQVDLAVSLALNFDQCDESLVLIVTVHNVGTVDVPAGIDALFFEGTDASGLKLGAKPTFEPLPAGSSTEVAWVVAAPGEGSDFYVEVDRGPSIVECDENNNSAVVMDAACPD